MGKFVAFLQTVDYEFRSWKVMDCLLWSLEYLLLEVFTHHINTLTILGLLFWRSTNLSRWTGPEIISWHKGSPSALSCSLLPSLPDSSYRWNVSHKRLWAVTTKPRSFLVLGPQRPLRYNKIIVCFKSLSFRVIWLCNNR